MLVVALLLASFCTSAFGVGVCPGCMRSQWYRYKFSEAGGAVFGYYSTSCDFFTTTHGDPRFYTCGHDFQVRRKTLNHFRLTFSSSANSAFD
jgi:hypothetical protein